MTDPTSTFEPHKDAFSSGQVGSKLWLCDELERVLYGRTSEGSHALGDVVWIYGGWHGVLGFLLLARAGARAGGAAAPHMTVRSFDSDPASEAIANTLCENWVWREWQFRAFTRDCNELLSEKRGADPAPSGATSSDDFGPRPTVIINTSVEHFDRDDWFQKIPEGTLVALQAADFDHDGAVSPFKSVASLKEKYPMKEVLFSGEMKFDYGSWSFKRFMTIGFR